ncbi:Polyphenol oxidase A1 [Spatholobus suberectus]|nr:Polyphenol oxidase A1 [Spatholobus suberectus]
MSCSGNQNNPTPNTSEGELPRRRNVLFGLGGLCGAVTLNNNPFASAAPVPPPGQVNFAFPLVLDSAVSAAVKRPNKSRSKKEKEEEEEVLVIEGIEFEGNAPVKFDVIINQEEDDIKLIRPNNTEFAGSFVSLPQLRKKKILTSMRLGITDLLEELGADDDDSLVVTLVPRQGRVKIRGIRTQLLAD